jgi:transposase
MDGQPVYQTKMHSGGNHVMFWGCISQYHVGPIVSIKGSMTGKEYMKILKEEVWPELDEAQRIHPGHWRFMQDNAPVHRSKANIEFLASTGIDTIDWPPYSPDLNPIENVWNWIKLKLETEFPVCNSAEQIEARVEMIWARITPEMCANWCKDYHRRLLAVIKAKGGHTKY